MALSLCIFELLLLLFEHFTLCLKLSVLFLVKLQSLEQLLILGFQVQGHLRLRLSFILKLADQSITLLELLFNNLQLLRVCKRIFGLNNFFQAGPQTKAFVLVHFNLHFSFVCAGVFDVSL